MQIFQTKLDVFQEMRTNTIAKYPLALIHKQHKRLLGVQPYGLVFENFPKIFALIYLWTKLFRIELLFLSKSFTLY